MNFFRSKYFFNSSVSLLKNKLFPIFLGIPLFFCLHHYEGIFGDARLYLLQVVNRWHPERFVNDPPFMFGNQDAFGVFSLFYDFVLRLLGIDKGAFYFTLVGQSLWLAAAYYFIYQFSKKMQVRLWFAPLMFCIIFYSGYNMPNDHIFFWRFVENNCVSRLFSLSIALFGLGTLFASKKYASLVLFLFGTAIHPLTAGWCLPLWFFLYYPKIRIPIIIISALLPLTFLLHRGPFDIYPADWGNCTHDHPVMFLMIWRELLALIFLGLFAPKFISNKTLLMYIRSIFLVILIGLYWSLTGGIAKHILIYQVQTWRVEWLFFIFSVPIYAYIIYGQISLFRHKRIKQLTSRHISLFLIGFTMFMPAPCSGAAVLALVLLLAPEKKWNLMYSLFIISALCLLSACAQEVTNIFLLGVIDIPLVKVADLFRECDNLLFLQFLSIMAIIVECAYVIAIEKKCIGLLIFVVFSLLLYIAFPQFQLVPVALTVVILYSKKKIRLMIFVPILLLFVLDCFFCDMGYRETNILNGLPRNTFRTLVWIVPVIAGMMMFFVRVSNGVRVIALIALSFVITVFAYDGYDKRDSSEKKSESRLDLFKDRTIFPQIKDRGKMFYYVKGDLAEESRVQFLTGSYFSETTPVGEPLFQGQFEEERKRLNYIFFKEQRGFIAKRGDWRRFVKDSLSQKDILLDRVDFLCSIGEISHLVSSFRLREYQKLDSLSINMSETIYLYGCPNAKD